MSDPLVMVMLATGTEARLMLRTRSVDVDTR